jgi:hypothetical protein
VAEIAVPEDEPTVLLSTSDTGQTPTSMSLLVSPLEDGSGGGGGGGTRAYSFVMS